MKNVFPVTNCSGKTAKPFPVDKVVGKGRMHLTENNVNVKTEILNTFFNNALQYFEIQTHQTNYDPVVDNVRDPTLKAVLNRYHTSIIAINYRSNGVNFPYLKLLKGKLRKKYQQD